MTVSETSEEAWPCQHINFGPVKPTTDFWPPELLNNKLVLNHYVCGHLLQQYKETNIFSISSYSVRPKIRAFVPRRKNLATQ